MITLRLSVGWERLLLQLDALYGHMCLRDPPCRSISDILARDLETHVVVLLKSDVSTEWFLNDVLHGIVLCSFRDDLLRDTDRVASIARDVFTFVSSVVSTRTVPNAVFDDPVVAARLQAAGKFLCDELLQNLAWNDNSVTERGDMDPADAAVMAVRLLKDLQVAAQRVFAVAAAKLEFLLERERLSNRDTRRYAERVMTRAKRFVVSGEVVDRQSDPPARTLSSATLPLTATGAPRLKKGDVGVEAEFTSGERKRPRHDVVTEAVTSTANLDAALATAPLPASLPSSPHTKDATGAHVLGIRVPTTALPNSHSTRASLFRVTGETPLARVPIPVFNANCGADESTDDENDDNERLEDGRPAKRALLPNLGTSSDHLAPADLLVSEGICSLVAPSSMEVAAEVKEQSASANETRGDLSSLTASGIPSLLERSIAADARALMSDTQLAAMGSRGVPGVIDDDSAAGKAPPAAAVEQQSMAVPRKRRYFMVPKPKASRPGTTAAARGPLFLPVELSGLFDV